LSKLTGHDRGELQRLGNLTGERIPTGSVVTATCDRLSATTVTGALQQLLQKICDSKDHGGFGGLGDDDHPQYLNEDRHDDLDHDFVGCLTSQSKNGVPAKHTNPRATLCITDDGTDTTMTANTGNLIVTNDVELDLSGDFGAGEVRSALDIDLTPEFSGTLAGGQISGIDISMNENPSGVAVNDKFYGINIEMDDDIHIVQNAVHGLRARLDTASTFNSSGFVHLSAEGTGTGFVTNTLNITNRHATTSSLQCFSASASATGADALSSWTGTLIGMWGQCSTPDVSGTRTKAAIAVLGHPDVTNQWNGSGFEDEVCTFKGYRGTIYQDQGDLILNDQGGTFISTPADASGTNIPVNWTIGAWGGNGFFAGAVEANGTIYGENTTTAFQGQGDITSASGKHISAGGRVVATQGLVTNRVLAPQITSNQTAWDPGDASVIFVDSDASREVQGINVAGMAQGFHMWIINDGSFDIVFMDSHASASENDKIDTLGTGDITVAGGESIHLIYGTSKWYVFA
jgi:hypothetical protein